MDRNKKNKNKAMDVIISKNSIDLQILIEFARVQNLENLTKKYFTSHKLSLIIKLILLKLSISSI